MRISRRAALLLLLCGCSRAEEAKEVAAAVLVRAQPAFRGEVADTVEAAGILEAPPGMDVKLAPLSAGRLAQVLVAEGDRVRHGQLLARLDPTPLRDAAAQAEAQLAQAKAQQSNSATRLERAGQAFAAGVATGQEVDDARLQADSARAAVRSAEAALSTARNQQARGDLRAPFDGVVARLFVPAGEPVDPGRPVVEVARVETLELRAPLAQGLAIRLRPGQPAALLVEGGPPAGLPATLLAVAPVLDPQSGAALARIRVPNPAGALKIGAPARARITVDLRRGALLVPREALLGGAEGPGVEVIEAGKAKRVPVRLGYQDGAVAEVLEGLTEGQPVVVQGAYALPDGTPVRAEAAPDACAPLEGRVLAPAAAPPAGEKVRAGEGR